MEKHYFFEAILVIKDLEAILHLIKNL